MIAEALRTLARGLRYNVEQARADLDTMAAPWTGDKLAHQGYQNGRISAMESVAVLVEYLAESDAGVLVDVADWARWPEVVEFARRHDVTESHAIRTLVNAGLTHEPESYVVTPAGPREESDEDRERAYEAGQ